MSEILLNTQETDNLISYFPEAAVSAAEVAFGAPVQQPSEFAPGRAEAELLLGYEVDAALEDLLEGDTFVATPEEHERLNNTAKYKDGTGNLFVTYQ